MLNLKCVVHEENGAEGFNPVYQTAGAACADVALPKALTLEPGEIAKVDLLISFDIPATYKIVMYPRSSLLIKKGIMSPTSIIDSDYKGHVHVPLANISGKTVHFEKGERVAQIEAQALDCNITYDGFIVQHKERDQNGFGGTGAV